MTLLIEVETHLRLVSYAPGRIEFQPTEQAPADLASRLGQRLHGWTGQRWGVSVVAEGGAKTVAEERAERESDLEAQARAHPLVQAVFEAFPDAKLLPIKEPLGMEDNADIVPIDPEDDEEWDPFES
jgi:DNA polymerase-3 subunit gamma/tau